MTEQNNNEEHKIKDWFTETYDYKRPSRGQIREGVILRIEEQGVTLDVGLKRDGFVPTKDIDRLEREDTDIDLEPGEEVSARVVRPEDREGKLVLSIYQALSEQDWKRAEEMLESGQVWQGTVTDYNKGGLLAKFGRIRGFIPGSHLWRPGKRPPSTKRRKEVFKEYVGEELPLKVIEVNRRKQRLILSERLARRQMRKQQRKRLLEELVEGEVVEGTVRHLADFGAFVDLGGADGLVHISELAWQHVDHPSDVLDVGDQVKVYILRLDHERKRIGLSLKRLQPKPWDLVDTTYTEGQLVQGTVTSIANFGAFVALGIGVEGLVHISELSDPSPNDPRAIVKPGDELILRILDIDSARQRIGLSLKRVTEQEREDWLAQQAPTPAEETEEQAAEAPEEQQAPVAEEQTAAEAKEPEKASEEQTIAAAEEQEAPVAAEQAVAEAKEPDKASEEQTIAAAEEQEAPVSAEQAVAEAKEPDKVSEEQTAAAEQAVAEAEDQESAPSADGGNGKFSTESVDATQEITADTTEQEQSETEEQEEVEEQGEAEEHSEAMVV